ncbi:MAG: glycosyltransferase [Pseudomonadota bacterium]|jgi:glycosyltransferase involved in cell wall biosynthesis
MLYTAQEKNKRIFWLGMHKILVETELKRLRILGYEVFNPPYLSSIIDQSAALDWKPPSDSTLPQEAIAILAKTNFFYAAIPPAAAEILNQYFGAVIVTINPEWLKNILKVYHGKLIYRVYGQPYNLSQYFTDNYVLDLITERKDFWFCPHHEKTLLIEDLWLARLNMRIIPYALSSDVISLQDTWDFQETYNPCMGLMCPRALDNTYYRRHYNILKTHFSGKNFKVFGVQIIPVPDPQVIGTLQRKDFLAYFLKLRGFIYHYPDPAVCYLPPIEFMTLGGPVLFLKDCLLSNYSEGPSAPGEAKNMALLAIRAEQLRKGDIYLSNEIIESQRKIRLLYHPSYVWPIFDKAIKEILGSNISAPAAKIIFKTSRKNIHSVNLNAEESILIPFHNLGISILKSNKKLSYYSAEGIVRVTNLMVNTLINNGKIVIITCRRCDFGKVHGFFTQYIKDYTKLKILIIENGIILRIRYKTSLFLRKSILLKKTKILFIHLINFLKKTAYKIKLLLNKPAVQRAILSIQFSVKFIKNIFSGASSYIHTINKNPSISHIVIPHYYLFPETQAAKKTTFLYLPDYLPHFYKDSLAMGDHWTWRYIGKKLARKAELIITNSEVTRDYLPNSVLRIKKEKIINFPLAYLNQIQEEKNDACAKDSNKDLPPLFVIYPTRNRPSKRLNDFSEVIYLVNNRLKADGDKRRIYGVLTAAFIPNIYNKYLINLQPLPDILLTKIYKHAVALLFTSENEGNFPTQINEALYLDTPIIATNIPQITTELGELANTLQLIEVGDHIKFADAILYTMDNREKVLHTQQKAREYIINHFSNEQFSRKLLAIFSKNFTKLTDENT